jgi:hypothetical protein
MPFYYGSGSETVTGTVINYGSGSAKAKSYGSYSSGSETLDRILYILIFRYLFSLEQSNGTRSGLLPSDPVPTSLLKFLMSYVV